ncbi:D-2-hydroxyacid dehydrogenase family protein [Pseudomonas sp. TKO26]|uniref:D-2-hydroxyacid dehydrogenase family protein n=1 Tax=unclassified Pseudomonas TaxID=196821 RepID=UPI000D8749A8|nr:MULTISPECIES: D-2-hydroxyacid dehydrogenase family protein [unclassified Pseudomonas]PYY78467.1 D-2-hydroxyacid dehydrogenase family protein [Pseudomonas sp. TKO30]PYY79280.1 D-2-hydroxyacid dehydrogenase family protein [Pseudomonas sp. TKO29]PYY81148.1 D-2-hydroxyacid dehydrogenase family protein [Pseudomonas sp. TKO26]PYY96084.1 D-2-hydroxyacid dehydrogenase family protein [Pseudomonas sp. TKO14]
MTLQIAVIDDWQDVAREVVDWSVLQSIGQVSFLHDYPGQRELLVQRLLPFQVICVMRERTLFDADLLQRLPRLKLLLTGGMRNAAIDLEAAKALGIQVCGSDSYRQAAPELTWALLMALTRNLLNEANALRAGHWQQGLGGDLHGKTLGLLGLGNIGQRVAQFGQVFGMRVIAWSENLSAERAAAAGVIHVDKQALFEQADVLSVHLVLSERSRHLVDAQTLAWMKPDALLINTARGPIVDEAALIAALEQGRLAGAALDVFAEEPLPAEHPFRHLPNVLATPHIGYVTRQNYRLFFSQMIEDLQAWHAGRPIRLLN